MLILPVSRLEENKPFPLDPAEFEEQLTLVCEDTRRVLLKKWQPACADILLAYKQDWRQYAPKNVTDSTDLIERFFRCINVLLSQQLRWLVMKSLNHFVDFLVKFKVRW